MRLSEVTAFFVSKSVSIGYAYLTSDGHPFNYVAGLNYGTFANGELVITSWKNYPDSFVNQIGRHKADHCKRKIKH